MWRAWVLWIHFDKRWNPFIAFVIWGRSRDNLIVLSEFVRLYRYNFKIRTMALSSAIFSGKHILFCDSDKS